MRSSAGGASGSTTGLVVIVGPLPPPVHGMALVTAGVLDRVSSRARVVRADTSPRSSVRGVVYHARRIVRVLLAMAELVRHAAGGPRSLYLASDGGWGILYGTAIVAVARCLRYPIVVHHHNASYVVRRDRRMEALVRAAGPAAVHVLLGAGMRDRFLERYPRARRAIVVSNAHLIEARERPLLRTKTIRIGHLGNLTRSKGLDLVLDLARKIHDAGLPVEVDLAGPLVSAEDERSLRAALDAAGRVVTYRGAVSGTEKARFLGGIDVFVFPSRLHEAQPLVILEALAHGVPVIAFDRGCIREILDDSSGRLVPSGSDFVEEAMRQIEAWLSDTDRLARAGREASARFARLQARSEREARRLVDVIVGAPIEEAASADDVT